MTNKIETGINSKGSIEEYLIDTYGEKRLNESKQNSSYTHLDVIGYTLDKMGYEIQDHNSSGYGNEYKYKDYYELDEIEEMMNEKWEEKDEEWDAEYVGSEDRF
jgi:hypothetical protein